MNADIPSILANLAANIPALEKLVFATAYLVAIWLAGEAFFKLKAIGDGNRQITLRTPLVLFFVSIMLLALPETISTFLVSTFDRPDPLDYPSSTNVAAQQFIRPVITFIQFIGLVGFFRGWLLVKRMGDGNAPDGTLGRAIWHLFGGVMAINIVQFSQVIGYTFLGDKAPAILGVIIPFN